MHQKKLVSGSEACHISIIASLVLLCFAWEFDQDRKKKEKGTVSSNFVHCF